MADKQFTVTGPFPAYNTPRGGVVTLDADDPLVQANVAAGVIGSAKTGKPAKPPAMTCPACAEQGVKSPPAFSSSEELASHYGEAHPALAAPAFTPEEE